MLEKRKRIKGFGQRIKELRNERKLTQVEFGKILAIEGSYISIMEKHDVYPDDRIIWTLCSKLGVLERWLKTGEVPKYKIDSEIRDVSIDYKIPPGPVDRSLAGVKEIYSHGDPYLIQVIESAIYLARKTIQQEQVLNRIKGWDEQPITEEDSGGEAVTE